MTKIRKVKRRKKFRVNVNRKRLRNKQRRLPPIQCPQLKAEWDTSLSVRTNLAQMGLAYNANETFKVSSSIEQSVPGKILRTHSSEEEEVINKQIKPTKLHVLETLRQEAQAPRVRLFRLPKSQVTFLTYLLKKYGDDYKAMAKDKKNYDQMTWKQIRAKINRFKRIPEQYNLEQKSDSD